MLQSKNRLERLELQWTKSTPNGSAKQVLEGLLPHKNLKELIIRKCSGSEFPEWLGTPQVCGMLKTINLVNCEACTNLPSLGQLPALKTLCVESMNKLTHLGVDFFRGCFPCLESFKLCELPNLTEWVELAEGCMPRVRELQIVECQRLTKVPPLNHLGSLESVEFHDCPTLEQLPLLSSSLKTLLITKSDILGERCQFEHLDWHKIRGVNVVIDSERVDTSLSAPVNEHCPLLECSVVNETDSLCGSGRDSSQSICQQEIKQLDARETTCQQMGLQHASTSLTVHINEESKIIQRATKRMRFDGQMVMDLTPSCAKGEKEEQYILSLDGEQKMRGNQQS